MLKFKRLLFALLVATGFAGCGGSSRGPAPAAAPPPPPPAPALLGRDACPSNLSCIAPARQVASVDIELVREFQNLGFSQPLGMLQAPGDASRWFVLEKTGRV